MDDRGYRTVHQVCQEVEAVVAALVPVGHLQKHPEAHFCRRGRVVLKVEQMMTGPKECH